VKDQIAIGVLAYNVADYVEEVLSEIQEFKLEVYVIDDASTDDTAELLEKLKNKFDFKLKKNLKNSGAGYSTKLLIDEALNDGYKFLIKVDGDGQFEKADIKKIIDLYKRDNYNFIKSNRFWNGGIKGKIPKKRLFGNLFATILLQIVTGTNKLYDPLNGLFGVSTEIAKDLDKYYPKRYGYPFYITAVSVMNELKTFQINNVVKYENQKSNLKPLKVLAILLRLSVFFYFKKIKIKKSIGIYQRSAFLDLSFLTSFFITLYLIIQVIYIVNFASYSLIAPRTILIILFLNLVLNLVIFILSFKEEKAIRNAYIDCER
jgi:glycosyltransferase involved in cell wall biosynthesis